VGVVGREKRHKISETNPFVKINNTKEDVPLQSAILGYTNAEICKKEERKFVKKMESRLNIPPSVRHKLDSDQKRRTGATGGKKQSGLDLKGIPRHQHIKIHGYLRGKSSKKKNKWFEERGETSWSTNIWKTCTGDEEIQRRRVKQV